MVEIVRIQSPNGARSASQVVLLGRVSDPIVGCKGQTLLRELLEDRVASGSVEIRIFEPDLLKQTISRRLSLAWETHLRE
jgi:hypothetical protein